MAATPPVLDTIDEQLTVIARCGSIVSTNASWHDKVGSPLAATDWPLALAVGDNYLVQWQACARQAVPGARTACAALEAVLAGRQRRSEVELHWPAPGPQRCLRLTVSAMGDANVVVLQADLSALREAQTQLRIAAVAFDTPQGQMVTDAAGRIVKINRAFSVITGYQPEDVLGQRASLLGSGRHGAAFYQAMWSALRASGSWQGEVWNRRKQGEVYPVHLHIASVEDGAGDVTHYVGALSDVTLSVAASEEIRHLALYDPLTRLPNRRLLLERLAQSQATCAASGTTSALLFIDLDHFKTLNDTLGRGNGDLLLQQVALRLQRCLRHCDLAARVGGDEFVLLFEQLDQAAPARALRAMVDSAMAAFDSPFDLGEHTCRTRPSIGVALVHGATSVAPEVLLQQADIAMFQAKQGGRNGVRYFDPAMQDALRRRAQIEQQLREALAHRQFALHYQVQVDHGGHAVGAEALLRWHRADGADVAPVDFIGVAEETGLILPLGHWVLEQACAQLAAWHAVPWMRTLRLAINVSARQFHHSDFCDRVADAIARHQIDPARLKLELTEGILLDNLDGTMASLHRLKDMGLSIALDDFGTGYSSLQYLKRLPLDQLKIDQSFVRDLAGDANDQAIVLTIIMMANSLGLDVIAEGVETAAQRTLLETLGCHCFQGYLFSRAVDADAFARLLGPCPPAWPGCALPASHPPTEESSHA